MLLRYFKRDVPYLFKARGTEQPRLEVHQEVHSNTLLNGQLIKNQEKAHPFGLEELAKRSGWR